MRRTYGAYMIQHHFAYLLKNPNLPPPAESSQGSEFRSVYGATQAWLLQTNEWDDKEQILIYPSPPSIYN